MFVVFLIDPTEGCSREDGIVAYTDCECEGRCEKECWWLFGMGRGGILCCCYYYCYCYLITLWDKWACFFYKRGCYLEGGDAFSTTTLGTYAGGGGGTIPLCRVVVVESEDYLRPWCETDRGIYWLAGLRGENPKSDVSDTDRYVRDPPAFVLQKYCYLSVSLPPATAFESMTVLRFSITGAGVLLLLL